MTILDMRHRFAGESLFAVLHGEGRLMGRGLLLELKFRLSFVINSKAVIVRQGNLISFNKFNRDLLEEADGAREARLDSQVCTAYRYRKGKCWT